MKLLKPKTVRQRIEKLRAELAALHNEVNSDIAKLQKRCPHKNKGYKMYGPYNELESRWCKDCGMYFN